MSDAPTKLRFLTATAELLRRQGYSGTGLKQVTAEAAAPWGSMYHFFPDGKEQLGADAVRFAGERYAADFAGLFERIADPVAAVGRLFAYEADVLAGSDYRDGCPIASTAIDVVSTNERVREACSTVFGEWQTVIAAAFTKAGLDSGEADRIAAFVLATLEGAIILSRTHRSPAPLHQAAILVERALKDTMREAGVTTGA